MSCPSLFSKIAEYLHYNTVKIVKVKSWKLGTLHYICQLCIIAYVVIYSIVLGKGYQLQPPLVGDISTKLKGNAYYQNTTTSPIQVWDAVDVVYPPVEEGAIFIVTNVVDTRGQTRSECPAESGEKYSDTKQPVLCENDNTTCPAMRSTTNGITTGKCDAGTKRCSIYAWCPLPDEEDATALQGVAAMTLFVRATVKFPKYAITCGNYDGDTTVMGRNLFAVEDIVKASGYTMDQVTENGAVIGVFFRWECSFDEGTWLWSNPTSCPHSCAPVVRISRLDDPLSHLSNGSNFRYANYYNLYGPDGTTKTYRDAFKVYGIRIVFVQSGYGGKFDLVTVLTKLGAGIGLLAVATILCDFIATNLWPSNDVINDHKYEECDTATEDDVPQVDDNLDPRRPSDGSGRGVLMHLVAEE